jgi:hypothetical protein
MSGRGRRRLGTGQAATESRPHHIGLGTAQHCNSEISLGFAVFPPADFRFRNSQALPRTDVGAFDAVTQTWLQDFCGAPHKNQI